MHGKPDLPVFLKWMIAGSGSVITAVIPLAMSIESFLMHYTDAIELLREVCALSDEYWLEADETDEDVSVDADRIENSLAAQFRKSVNSIGRVRYMTALFCEISGRGAPSLTGGPGTIRASAFIWMDLSFKEWCEVCRCVEVVYGAWYELMWHLIGIIGIDYFAILETANIVSSEEILRRRKNYPFQIRVSASTELETPTGIEEKHARELIEVRDRLISQGAVAATVNEPDYE